MKLAEYHARKRQTPEGKARIALREAVRWGRIDKPTACEGCGEEPSTRAAIHGHHHDYSKPLEVRWLCATCHGKEHRVDA